MAAGKSRLVATITLTFVLIDRAADQRIVGEYIEGTDKLPKTNANVLGFVLFQMAHDAPQILVHAGEELDARHAIS